MKEDKRNEIGICRVAPSASLTLALPFDELLSFGHSIVSRANTQTYIRFPLLETTKQRFVTHVQSQARVM